ncbi:MAG: TonB-dependent receptor [Bacteroides sp.]|nr:TonB-dependent receptor [Bacteroides sp.]
MKKNKTFFLVSMLILTVSFSGRAAIANPTVGGSSIMETAQQNITAKGTVTDALGEPVIGASVLEKGTSNGVVTDLNGKFTLSVKNGAILVISFIGYKSQEMKATSNLKITLTEDSELLEEVVVVGYGVQKKKLVTGATVQVKGEDIVKLNTPNVLGALQSQAPGVEITQVSGFVGDGYKVNIRGLGTNGNSSPLYVVDGVVGGSIDGLSPNDIASMDVLKDAASAAIYGARAANGVILVTTKKGKAGVSEITYDGYYGIQNLYKIPTVLTAQEYMYIQDESRVINGFAPNNWASFLPDRDLNAINEGTWKGTNWLKEILNKNAVTQSHSLNFTTGTDRSTTSIGVTYMSQEATMGVPSAIPHMDRINARINTEQSFFKKGNFDILKIGETMKYKFQTMDGTVPRDDIYWNTIHNMLVMSPLMHPYKTNGSYYLYADQETDGYSWDVSNNANKNPIANMDYNGNQNQSKSHYLQSSVYAEIQPIKKLRIRSQFGYMMSASTYRSYVPAYEHLTSTLYAEKDRVSQSSSMSYRWTLDNTVNYIFDIGKHNFDVMVGQSLEKSGYGLSMSAASAGSSYTDFEHAYLSNTQKDGIQSLSGTPDTQNANSSFFGRVNYNYDEKYMASVILRADGSSIFPRGNRWGYFPSFSAGWVISQEEFWNVRTINFLKLRVSYGQNGNNRISANQHLALITTDGGTSRYGNYPFGNNMAGAEVGAYPMRLTNPDIKWETQTMIDVGIDARLLQDRLSVEMDAYQRSTVDWLTTPAIPSYWGSGAAYVNGGNVKNTGFEAILRWNDNINKDLSYNVSWNISINKNEVTKLSTSDGVMHGSSGVLWGTADECYRMEVGEPMGFFYGYKTAGVFQNQEQIDNYQGAKLGTPQPGDLIWVDDDGDGKITAADRTKIGNPHPDVTTGFSFSINYKGIDLSVNTYGAFGQQIMKSYRDYASSPLNNFTTDVFKRWHGEGTSNKFPRLSNSTHTNYSYVSDLYVENGDYLKIKNVTLGYNLKYLFPKLPVKQAKIYVTAQNLFTITGYSGMDPEIGYSAGDSWTKGIDLGFYPSARTYMMGVNINF